MQRQQEEGPLYYENHEAFRRLLFAGGSCLVIGVFFSDKAVPEALGWLQTWGPVILLGSGVLSLLMCFVLNPKQYSIYSDSLVVEYWYHRHKAVPFDQVTELKAWSALGKRNIIVMSRGPNWEFGWDCIAPRKIETFADRLEEAINRHRFLAGREPIQIQPERSRKDKKRE